MPRKVCTKCGEPKPRSEFRRDNGRADGLYAWCRPCCDAQDAKNAAQIRVRKQKYYLAKKDRITTQHRSWNKRNAKKISAYNHAWYVANKVKNRARAAVRKALLTGQLDRPAACARCARENLHLVGHHHSYRPEDWLDVEWLCRTCHARHHAQEEAAA